MITQTPVSADREIVIGRMSVVHRMVRIVFAAWMLATALAMAWMIVTAGGGDAPPPTVVIPVAGVVGWLLLAMIGRNLHAFKVRPALGLSPQGIHLHNRWKSGPLSWVAPVHRAEEVLVPWGAYAGCQVFAQKVNGIPMYQELVLKRSSGAELRLGGRMFSSPPADLQGAILDYIEREFRRAARESAGLAEFQRRRWTDPLVFTYWTIPGWLPVGCLIAGIGVPATLPATVPADPRALAWIVGVGAGVGLGLYLGRRWWRTRRLGRIELRSEGLIVCRRDQMLPAIPWEELVSRPHTMAISTGGAFGAPRTTRLEVRPGDGSTRYIWPSRKVPLDYLQALLDPPLERVTIARERMSHGETVEDAARAAGLVSR